MKGMLGIVGFLIMGGIVSPVLAQADMAYNPPASQDAIETIKTINAKSNCNLQNAEPITVEAIGKDGLPLSNATIAMRLRSPKGETRLLPASVDQVLSQEKNRLVLKTDEKGQASLKLSKNAVAGKYPLAVQTSNQEFDLEAVCLGLRTDRTKQLFWVLVGLEMLLLLFSLFRAVIFRKRERLLIVSDLHGSDAAYAFLADKLARQSFHGVIIAGNLVDNTPNALEYAQSVFDLVQNEHKLPLFLIHGDSEPPNVTQLYLQSGRSVHLNPLPFSHYTIYGLGGTDIRVPELNLPKQGQTIFVGRIPSLPQGSRSPFVQITGHNQTAFSTSKRGSTVTIECPPASLGRAVILELPRRSTTPIQSPTISPAVSTGGLAWR